MVHTQASFILELRQSIDSQLAQGNRELASHLSKVHKHLPHCLAGAIAVSVEAGLDSYFIDQLKQTFG